MIGSGVTSSRTICAVLPDTAAQVWLSERDACSCLAKDGLDTLVGLAGADRQKGSARLEHGQRRDDLLAALLHHDGDELVSRRKHSLQLLSQHARASSQFAEAQCVVVADHSDSIRIEPAAAANTGSCSRSRAAARPWH